MSSDFFNDVVDLTDELALMQRVLDLATLGKKTTHPNPMDACIIINDGQIVAQAYHQKAGELHAERLALQIAGDRARGATVYVGLEPCCHQGRTPPCTDALINAGVAKVVAAMPDPNPLVYCSGVEQLTGAGIDVQIGVLEEQARWLNRGFVNRMLHQRPWVTLIGSATFGADAAAYNEPGERVNGLDKHQYVQQLIADSAAVVTGINTVLDHDPQFTVEHENCQRQPLRVVLDSHLRIPLDAKVIGADDKLMIFTLSQDIAKISTLTELGVEVVQHDDDGSGRFKLSDILRELALWQCNDVVIDAGPTLSKAFVRAGLIDELALLYTSEGLGGEGENMFELNQPLPFDNRTDYRVSQLATLGSDLCVNAVNETSVAGLDPK